MNNIRKPAVRSTESECAWTTFSQSTSVYGVRYGVNLLFFSTNVIADDQSNPEDPNLNHLIIYFVYSVYQRYQVTILRTQVQLATLSKF